jgi:pyruvate dehydrogenase complex dehydrogenase (E1) component
MAPSGKPNADAALHRLDRAAVVQSWVQALRDGANAAQLRAMAPLTDSEAAQVMALMRSAAPAVAHSGGAASSDVALDQASSAPG